MEQIEFAESRRSLAHGGRLCAWRVRWHEASAPCPGVGARNSGVGAARRTSGVRHCGEGKIEVIHVHRWSSGCGGSHKRELGKVSRNEAPRAPFLTAQKTEEGGEKENSSPRFLNPIILDNWQSSGPHLHLGTPSFVRHMDRIERWSVLVDPSAKTLNKEAEDIYAATVSLVTTTCISWTTEDG